MEIVLRKCVGWRVGGTGGPAKQICEKICRFAKFLSNALSLSL